MQGDAVPPLSLNEIGLEPTGKDGAVAITILCPACSTRLTLTDDRAGTQFTCPRCETKMMVPGTPEPQVFTPPAWTPQPPQVVQPSTPVREEDEDEEPSPKRRRDDDDYDDEEDDRTGARRRVQRRGFECPYCGSHRTPIVKSRISPTGWIVFTLLLIFTVCLCFIGLFITEEYRECRDCGMKIG